MAEAAACCVHGGFCPPACPIYLVLGEEMTSRRGRILLTKGAMRNNWGILHAVNGVVPSIGQDNGNVAVAGDLLCDFAIGAVVAPGDGLDPFLTEKPLCYSSPPLRHALAIDYK